MGLKKVSTENIIKGIRKSFNNAESLLQDATILQSKKKFPRAYTLCQIAIEELAKIPILIKLMTDRINNNNIEYEEIDYSFISHSAKTKISIEYEIGVFKQLKNIIENDCWNKLIESSKKLIPKIQEQNELKKASLYVTIKGEDFQSPDEVIDEVKFKSLYGIALLRIFIFKKVSNITIENFNKAIRLEKES